MEVAALVLSIVGTVIGSLALGWQVAAFTLAGGRIRVEPRFGVGNAAGDLIATRPIDFNRVARSQRFKERGYAGTVVGAQVRNIGRMATEVERWTFVAFTRDTGSSGGLWGTEIIREVLQITPVGHGLMGKPLPHRLEPGASETWMVKGSDVQELVADAKAAAGREDIEVMIRVHLADGRSFQASEDLRNLPR